ncbi:MAG: HlyD family efflux transporter periplasmic adaptor subunit [Myxococcota bacterium]
MRKSRVGLGMSLAILAALAAALTLAWWLARRSTPPEGFAVANGRLESEEIHVATKLPGRLAEVRVAEGDDVTAGQVLARMDTKSLEAQLAQAKARVAEAHTHRDAAKAFVAQRMNECTLARTELERTEHLFERDVASARALDVDRSRAETAHAQCAAAQAQIANSDAGIAAATAEVTRIEAELADGVLVAPRSGRIQHRLAVSGEVLPAGGRVFTLLDLGDVYMTVFLPAGEAGRVPIGAEARVVLDATPEAPLRARVTFVSDQAQFTPKQVETASERQKLSFRVKARLVDGRSTLIKPGTPGVAWVRLDPQAAWPAWLE